MQFEIARHSVRCAIVTALDYLSAGKSCLGELGDVEEIGCCALEVSVLELAQVIFLTDVNAVVAENGIGRRHVKIKVRYGVFH